MLGGPKAVVAAPYRPDMSDEEFVAVGDVVVCTLAPSREKSTSGLVDLPDHQSPFHIVLDVGPKVAEVCGLELEPGDVIAFEGAAFADTLAGRVWFPRAEKILSVVKKREAAPIIDLETEPPPTDGEPAA